MLAALLIAAVAPLLATPSPAQAAGSSGLSVVITRLTPSVLGTKGTVELSGRVTNTGRQTWTKVQAYLLIRPSPFIDRKTLKGEAEVDNGFAGTRIVETGRFAELGTVEPGASIPFTLSIPVKELPITGADGVYPIGVQLLGTDSDGERGNSAIARATTFLPRMSGDHPIATSTVVWSLLMPKARAADGRIVDVDDLLESLAPGGQLRNLLDTIIGSPQQGRGVLLDPALVVAADDLADGRAAGRKLTEDETAAATRFRDDLVTVGSSPSTWIVDYDRTDVLALESDAASRRRLFGAVERATDAVVDEYGLSRNRVSWPTADGVSSGLLRTIRERGDDPVVVSSASLPQWSPEDGVLVGHRTSGGDLPLLVDDDITDRVPGAATVGTLRQRAVADAALVSLAGGERRESLTLIGPTFDPGVGATWDTISGSFVNSQPLSALSRAGSYDGSIAAPTAKPISATQVAAADEAVRTADVLSTAAIDSQELDDQLARSVADVLGVRWRSDRAAGQTAALSAARRVAADLSSITVMAPPEVTLSSSEGGFPITITNGSDTTVRVGLRLDSSNPALRFPDQEPVEIAAGERRTVTVDVDLKEQNTTTVTAHLVTPDGRTFGSSDEFIVRSSRVGVVLWATMGAAAIFVVFALVRRFGRGSRETSPAGEPDE